MADPSAGHPLLLDAIRGEVRCHGSISFARFMELALYHEPFGYYARGSEGLGRSGDYVTASDVGRAFGETLARQFAEIDDLLGRPDPFRLVEFGAGRGLLVRDLLDAIREGSPERLPRFRATLLDRSASMREEAARVVPEAEVLAPDVLVSGGAGCVVAVELLDALPVHRVVRRGGALREIAVGAEGERLVTVLREPPAEVAAWASEYGAAPEDGDEAEVSLGLGPAVARLASAVDRGVVIVVDYGDTAERLYGPGRRRGTLLAYHRHRTSEEVLSRVGEQDLTAHVNFTALSREARRAGMVELGTTTQDRFLVASGILDGLDDERQEGVAAVKRRLQAKQLIHPDGMGRAFKFAIFAKGMEFAAPLAGLRDPFGGAGPRPV